MVTFRQDLQPSSYFASLLVSFHTLVAFVIFETALPMAARLALLLPVVASLAYYLARDALCLLPDSWKTLALDLDGATVIVRSGTEFCGQIAQDSFVSPYFIVLRVRRDGRRMPSARVIFPDALAADAFRELCVFFRFA